MKRNALLFAVAFLCVRPLMVSAEEEITGAKFQEFTALPDRYLERPVVLEDTFEKILEGFSRIETQNYFTSGEHLKFKLGQCPFPCIGMRTPSLEDAFGKCTRGELIRVTGNLQKVYEKRTIETTRGSFSGGRDWEERVYVSGPLKSEYFFSVGRIEKGWGRHDSPEDMFSEGKNLMEEHYQQVSPAAITGEPEKLVERSIWFEGAYGGFDEHFGEGEEAVGLTPEKVIKFRVKGMQMPCYVSKSESNVEGFKSVPVGSKVQVYGRIRIKETPKGLRSAFLVDRVTRTVSRKEVATPASKGSN